MKQKKILLVATAGGHLQELMALEPAYSEYDRVLLTDRFPWTVALDAYLVPRWTGKRCFYIRMSLYLLICGIYASWIFLRHRPKVMLTTGAEIALPAILLSKLFGCKSIFVESVTCFERPSFTARFALLWVNRFYSQQPETVAYDTSIIYEGSIV